MPIVPGERTVFYTIYPLLSGEEIEGEKFSLGGKFPRNFAEGILHGVRKRHCLLNGQELNKETSFFN